MADDAELIRQYEQIHAQGVYGNTSVKNLRFIRPQIALLGPRSVLDYGCGQSPLIDRLGLNPGVKLVRYDPAIPAYSTKPSEPVDLLINVDVLEHIPEDQLDGILAEMSRLCRDALIIVDTREAETVLPSGENAHCTVRPHEWWGERLSRHFGPVEPIRVARRSRAAFRTWSLAPAQKVQLRLMRLAEDAAWGWRRVTRGKREANV